MNMLSFLLVAMIATTRGILIFMSIYLCAMNEVFRAIILIYVLTSVQLYLAGPYSRNRIIFFPKDFVKTTVKTSRTTRF